MENLIREKWNEILKSLSEDYDLSAVSYNTWILPLKIHSFDEKNSVLLLVTDQVQTANFVHKRYHMFIQAAVEEITGVHCEVKITVPDMITNENEEVKKVPQAAAFHAGLNPRYTFENFVVGRNNSHAHAASLAVAERPGDEFNPLFIYGGPGLGKTHLLHAIAHFILKENPKAKVVVVSCEKFANDLIESLYSNRKGASAEEFREKYRKADALLIDDIQFIINKESTQEELFNTFNTLYESKKQIVFSSDRPPKDFVTLKERLTTRFGWGPIVDIGLPDYETRMAILRKKEEMLREEGKEVNIDNQVVQYIAANVVSDIRNLEGAIQKIMLLAKLKNIKTEEVDLEQAKEVLKDVINPNSKREITPDYIMEIVANHYHLNPSDLLKKTRKRDILYPRQISQYLIRDLTGITWEAIADIFGMDHATVYSSFTKIESVIKEDENEKNVIETLIKKINPS